MFQIRIPGLGVLSFHIDDMSHARHATILKTKDEKGGIHRVECNRIKFPDDRFADYGWVQIIGYTNGDEFISCNEYITLF